MRDAHCRVGSIHTLATVPGGAIDIDANIAVFDLDSNIVIGFWKNDYLGCGGMDAPVGLGNGNALDAMGTAFVFQAPISALASDEKRDVFDSPLRGFVAIQDFNLPVPVISITAVHAEEFCCKKRRFFATGSRLDGDDSIFLIHNIFGQQSNL